MPIDEKAVIEKSKKILEVLDGANTKEVVAVFNTIFNGGFQAIANDDRLSDEDKAMELLHTNAMFMNAVALAFSHAARHNEMFKASIHMVEA